MRRRFTTSRGWIRIYEFLDGNETDVSGVNFATATDRTWGGISAGGSYNWNADKYSLYSEVPSTPACPISLTATASMALQSSG
ncbi:hypothetical protein [Phyllobacterium zundukense]|uniref:Uncharacterized protein n=1 Tax=Phyllobacterium zundukense TaxID=1867719 RepID=A0ACD4CZS5_9HYPH|nr:hypothetical protein [Phyllobacterium zundukense]UXN59136.1 hypothetical protein N8E88_09720 [Phyllobacterium zundukense]